MRESKLSQRYRLTFTLLSAGYVGVLLIIAVANWIAPDYWWFTGANLYFPQVLWAMPGLILLPVALRAGRLAKITTPLALLWVIGPMMGFNVPLHAGRAGAKDVAIRVLTYNVKWALRDSSAEAADIARFGPAVIQFQDAGSALNSAIGRSLAGYHIEQSGQYVVASRLPLAPLESYDISFMGSHHHVTRGAIKVGKLWVAFFNVHLQSPRDGLVGIRHRNIAALMYNIDERLQQSQHLATYPAMESGPLIVTGDFNAPMQSLVCRRMIGAGMRDAFTDSGFGYGYTYGAFTKVGAPYVRIDHIFYNNRVASSHCWVGNRIGSDHCPVIADVIVKNAR